jgi:hypothetical protein
MTWVFPSLSTCCWVLFCDNYCCGFVTPVLHIDIGASIRVGSMRVPALSHSCCCFLEQSEPACGVSLFEL